MKKNFILLFLIITMITTTYAKDNEFPVVLDEDLTNYYYCSNELNKEKISDFMIDKGIEPSTANYLINEISNKPIEEYEELLGITEEAVNELKTYKYVIICNEYDGVATCILATKISDKYMGTFSLYLPDDFFEILRKQINN